MIDSETKLLGHLLAIEYAVGAHALLVPAERRPGSGTEPELRYGQSGWSAHARVRRRGRCGWTAAIHAEGATPGAAVAALIVGLDVWAEVLR